LSVTPFVIIKNVYILKKIYGGAGGGGGGDWSFLGPYGQKEGAHVPPICNLISMTI
jgi:hypothetical protein